MAEFDLFVVLAGMRTGSNFLETNLSALGGVTCHGEAFNPFFVGHPEKPDLLGITQAQRDEDPLRLLAALRDQPGGIGGFRYFHDHDPRILPAVLNDPHCAKVVLTRNPLETYVSLKLALATDIWRMTNPRRQQIVVPSHDLKVRFEPTDFDRHLSETRAFQLQILHALQKTGQTAFYLGYEDLFDLEVINGLGQWLGAEAPLASLDKTLKKQNAHAIRDRIENVEAMKVALAEYDTFDFSRTPNFEPRRGPVVPSWLAAPTSPLLYLPVQGGPVAAVSAWLSALDGGGELHKTFNQQRLRAWLADHRGARRFTVLRHPLARAHAAYVERILPSGPGSFREIRQALKQHFGLKLPKGEDDPGYDLVAHRDGLLKFLRFIRANLGGQTAQRTDPSWASQTMVLRGYSEWGAPDLVLREAELGRELPRLAERLGRPAPRLGQTDPHAELLASICDEELQHAARLAYPADFEVFGFEDYK